MEATTTNQQENVLNIFHFSSGDQPGSCGYCKVDGNKSKTSYSFGFSSEQICPEMYENLMFLNWRRCGDYIYKPDQSKSCCKLYTLRLDVDRFKIDKNQRRVMKNFRKYIAGIENIKNEENINNTSNISVEDKNILNLLVIIKTFLNYEIFISFIGCKIENPDILDLKVYLNTNPKFGDYTSNFFIILFYHISKQSENFSIQYTDANSKQIFYTKVFEIFLNYFKTITENENWKPDLSLHSGHLNFLALGTLKDQINQMRKQNLSNKKSEGAKIENKKENKINNYKLEYFPEIVEEPLFDSSILKYKYKLELEANESFRKEKYEVYKKYQIAVHKDKESDLSPDRYKNAWGTSNLKTNKLIKNANNNPLIPSKYGTYDLIHKINERIIAVGVLDILPHSVSSVYLYYDPEFSLLNPGVFSAIREIEYVKFLQEKLSSHIKYYCMGFYCHTCPKMKYKSQYSPSQLLCPVTYNWVDLDLVTHILEENKTTQLSNENKLEEVDLKDADIKEILSFLQLIYKNSEFGVLDFIKNYIRGSSRDVLINCLKNFILRVGKKNIMDFYMTIE
jgi:arginine-tRNA-protein transferase